MRIDRNQMERVCENTDPFTARTLQALYREKELLRNALMQAIDYNEDDNSKDKKPWVQDAEQALRETG